MEISDNVTLSLDGVLFLRILDAHKASYGVEDPEFAISQLAQTTMRQVFIYIEIKLLSNKIFQVRAWKIISGQDFPRKRIIERVHRRVHQQSSSVLGHHLFEIRNS
jgi:regulator of protease activity HflC (stomatin/prohibitin superfamily)